MKKLLSAGLALAGAIALLLPAVSPVAAQVGNQALLDITQPGGLMRVQIGAPSLVQVGTDFWFRPAGRFQFMTGPTAPIGGDPTRTGDENKAILSKSFTGTNGFIGYTSMLQFSVDTTVAGAANPVALFDTYAAMDAADVQANAGNLPNFWPVPLTSNGRGASGTSLIPLTDVGPTGSSLQVFHNYKLIGDALFLELVVTNTDTTTHSVGVRWAFDTGFGGTNANDGSSILLPGGTQFSTERVLPDASVASSVLPTSWVSYDDPTNPLISVKGLLDNAEVRSNGFAGSSAGVPNAVEFGMWNRIAAAGFSFVPNPGIALTGTDWGVGVKWNETAIAPGASRRFVTYIAYGASTSNYDTPFATMSYGPARLQQANGDDPNTPDKVESYYYVDGQGRSLFPLSVFVDNYGSTSLIGASASINLPTGLELIPATQARTQSLGVVPRDQLLGATWTVNADTARPGVLAVGLTGPRGRMVDRSIFIPAVPVLNPIISSSGLEMVSIPYAFTNNDAEHVFQSLGGLQPGQLGTLIRWDPVSLMYRWFPDPFVTNIQLGLGYWLLNRAGVQIVLPSDATPLPLTNPVTVDLTKGWNQIGDPFVLPMRFDSMDVITSRGAQISMIQAISQGLLQATVFAYDPVARQYVWTGDLSKIRLDPFVGYWILAYDNISLVMPPPTQVILAQTPLQTVAAASQGGWQTSLVLSGNNQPTATRAFGLRPGARDEADPRDIVAPPAPLGAQAEAVFVTPQGQQPGRYVDIKSADGAQKAWYLQVSSARAQQGMTLSWPDLSTVPESLVPILQDTATGACMYMRTTARYSFDMAEAGTRLFKITVQPRDSGAPLLSGVQAQAAAGGNYNFTYTLAAAAAVDVQIRNIAGLVVRRVASGQVSAAGANSLAWNGRSDSGSRLPAGRYLCQITAHAPESGQTSSLVTTFEVTR
jgi:hypothetical protein